MKVVPCVDYSTVTLHHYPRYADVVEVEEACTIQLFIWYTLVLRLPTLLLLSATA